MRTNKHIAGLVFGLLLSPLVQAGVAYVEPPVFMSPQLPAQGQCLPFTHTDVTCDIPGVPYHARVILQDQQSGYTEVQDEKTVVQFNCRDSICVDEYGGLVGQATGVKPGGIVRGSVTRGYYVMVDGSGRLPKGVTHKRGTGPLATQYPPYLVVNNPQANAVPVYDLYCDPNDDWCYLTQDGRDYKLSREELPRYVKMAPNTERCWQEVCVDQNQQIIGLNPTYHLWAGK
jgi:hypothetical protein